MMMPTNEAFWLMMLGLFLIVVGPIVVFYMVDRKYETPPLVQPVSGLDTGKSDGTCWVTWYPEVPPVQLPMTGGTNTEVITVGGGSGGSRPTTGMDYLTYNNLIQAVNADQLWQQIMGQQALAQQAQARQEQAQSVTFYANRFWYDSMEGRWGSSQRFDQMLKDESEGNPW